MSSAVLMERFSVGSQSSGGQAQSWQPTGFPGAGPAGNWCVVPRCKVEFEKCTGGFKIHCRCEDELSCATLQNLCRMMCDGCCSCCCTQNGIQCCNCTFANCHCKCEYTADGCCISLHQRRQAVLQYVASLLRLLRQVLRQRLLLLCVLQRHAGLLRHLLRPRIANGEIEKFVDKLPPGKPSPGVATPGLCLSTEGLTLADTLRSIRFHA